MWITALACALFSVTDFKSSNTNKYVKLARGYDFGPGALTRDTPTQLSSAAGRLSAAPLDAAEMLSRLGSINAVLSAFSTNA
jgi:hypothetical protein